MSEQPSASSRVAAGSRTALGVAGRLSLLGMISFLYLALVGAVVMGFSGYILRVNFERDFATIDGGLENLLLNISQEEVLRQEIDQTDETIAELTRKYSAATILANEKAAEFWTREAEARSVIAPVSLLLSEQSELFSTNYIQVFRDALYGDTPSGTERINKMAQLIATPEFAQNVARERAQAVMPQFIDTSKRLGELSLGLSTARQEWSASETEKNLTDEERQNAMGVRKTYEEALAKVRDTEAFGSRAKVVSLKSSPLLVLFFHLVQVPTIILTMIVTIAAGGLGSLVAFTRAVVYDVSDATIQMLYVSVGEGVAAAVAIFFLAGAGMLMLSTGGNASGAAELSPYMVAFLAFVSGFMAEDAFRSIQRAGRNLFKGDDDDPRPAPVKPEGDA